MRSSPFPWMNLMVLTKFLVIGTILQITMARITTVASHGNRKTTANLGRTGTTNKGRTEIISHGKTKIKSHGKTTRAKVINPVTPVLHCPRIKSSLFQQIVMRMCSRSSAPWSKHKLTKQNNQVAMGKEINEISKDTLVNLLNISDAKHMMRHSQQFRRQKNLKFHLLPLPPTD